MMRAGPCWQRPRNSAFRLVDEQRRLLGKVSRPRGLPSKEGLPIPRYFEQADWGCRSRLSWVDKMKDSEPCHRCPRICDSEAAGFRQRR